MSSINKTANELLKDEKQLDLITKKAFDSYDNYSMLKNEFGFIRACIPLNLRNSKASSNTPGARK